MATVKATFYLPLKDNDGRDLGTEIEAARKELWIRFTAYTFEGRVEGAYLMADGSQALDVSQKYSLVLDEARLGEVEEVLLAFKGKTLQEKMYLEIQRGIELRLI
jgi:hypothetical protein